MAKLGILHPMDANSSSITSYIQKKVVTLQCGKKGCQKVGKINQLKTYC